MMTQTWDRVVYEGNGTEIGTEPLRGLINGDHAVVVLRGLLPAEVFAENKQRILPLRDAAAVTQYVNGSLTLIGVFLVRYLSHVDDYFQDARAADEVRASLGFDLTVRVRAKLREVLGLHRFDVAAEPDGRQYASSNLRICRDTVGTPLHNDNIMRDGASSGLVLSRLRHQLSCVVCLQGCERGGELSIYQKPWRPADEIYKIPNGLGYDMGVVAGTAAHNFRPETGDIYLLNPTYYHAVEPAYGVDRITLGFFFGFFDDRLQDGVTWV